MKIVIDVIGGSDMDNELTVFLLQHKIKFSRLPDLPQTDVSGWQDFDLAKPQQEQKIIILKQNGEVGSAIYDDWFLEKARRLKHKWIPMPA